MGRATLNLGILAHVDAGKTTLTERLLYEVGAIAEVGSVDAGTTQTDSLELERRRGITIRSAVAAFSIGDVAVNLIDTPGHPDFIAEVERVLSVLDGAVLVVSAVEGVQPQTRVLMRALRRLNVPTLLFVNKIDRGGAEPDRVTREIARRLGVATVPMGTVAQAGTPEAAVTTRGADDATFRDSLVDVLVDHSDQLLASYIADEASVTDERLRHELAAQTGRALLHPVFFGSAVTGAGVTPLMAGLTELLPAATGDDNGPVSGRVFKIERGRAGEKVAYLRLFSGTVDTRDRLHFGADVAEKVTAVKVFDSGAGVRPGPLRAGEIGQLWGLTRVRVGDRVGERASFGRHDAARPHFAPPTLESVVTALRPEDAGALRDALGQLAEQDPLINVRRDDLRGEISVSLYGEVQKEVIQATLAGEFGIEAEFRQTTTICVERPAGTGEAVEVLNGETNPFHAELGFRVSPAPQGTGVDVQLRVEPRMLPLYIYKNLAGFASAIEGYVDDALREGRYGWQVTDCSVELMRCDYTSWDGPPSKRGPNSTAADYRKLAPMVLMQALERAGTVVCEPHLRVKLEVPTASAGGVLSALSRLGAAVDSQAPHGELTGISLVLPAVRAQELQRQLPGLTGGEGVLESRFDGYRRVVGDLPVRPRTTADPLNRDDYLRSLSGVAG